MKLYKSFYIHYMNYAAPRNLNNSYSLGFILSILFLIQIITGFFIIIYYIPQEAWAYKSVSFLMKDVKGGWLTRYLHTNASSLIFVLLYLHIGKNIYYGGFSKNSKIVWISGYLIFLLNIITSFLGYVLPYGQMSYWGATVIFQLVSTIPLIGDRLVLFLWGDYKVNTVTLGRIFSLHYILPFIIMSLILVHLICMHSYIINTPNRWNSKILMKDYKNISLYPYHINKDFFFFMFFFFILTLFVAYYPESLFNPINYVKASPIETPKHIIPEWYFLPLYSILKIIPNKSLGIAVMLGFLALPFISVYFINIAKFLTLNISTTVKFWLFIFLFFWDYFINLVSGSFNIFYWLSSKCFTYPFCILPPIMVLFYIYIKSHKNYNLIYYFKNNRSFIANFIMLKILYKSGYLIITLIFVKYFGCSATDVAVVSELYVFFLIYIFIVNIITYELLESWYNRALRLNAINLGMSLNTWVFNYSVFIASFTYLIDIGYWPVTAIMGSYGPAILTSFYLGWLYFYKSEKYTY